MYGREQDLISGFWGSERMDGREGGSAAFSFLGYIKTDEPMQERKDNNKINET